MHQNLLDRPDLPADRRTMATYELAQDFLRAGLLDRAEQLFAKLAGTAYEIQSLAHLISIYEQEKDWAKAIDVTAARSRRSPPRRLSRRSRSTTASSRRRRCVQVGPGRHARVGRPRAGDRTAAARART